MINVPTRQFSHIALGVGRGEGSLAAALLRHLGLAVTDNGPSLLGDPWFTAVIDPDVHDGYLGNLGFFVTPISDAQVALERAMSELAEVEGLRAEKRRKPDSSPHVAISYRTLDDIADAVTAIETDSSLTGRHTILRFRPLSASDELESLLDRFSIFSGADRLRYLSDGVQVFLQTDLFSAGLLVLGQSIELNWTRQR
jgi:hypothetical protein